MYILEFIQENHFKFVINTVFALTKKKKHNYNIKFV